LRRAIDVLETFLRDSCGDAHRCHSTRLGDDDICGSAAAGVDLVVEDKLR
jgi:hypothetical protein